METTIIEIIDLMEEAVDKAASIPFSGKILVDKKELQDYIQSMREAYPKEVQEANWLKDKQKKIISEAEAQADSIIKKAETKVIQMVDETEIVRTSQAEADKLVSEAQSEAARLKTDSDQYADDVLNDIERRLEMLLNKVQEDRNYFHNA